MTSPDTVAWLFGDGEQYPTILLYDPEPGKASATLTKTPLIRRSDYDALHATVDKLREALDLNTKVLRSLEADLAEAVRVIRVNDQYIHGPNCPCERCYVYNRPNVRAIIERESKL